MVGGSGRRAIAGTMVDRQLGGPGETISVADRYFSHLELSGLHSQDALTSKQLSSMACGGGCDRDQWGYAHDAHPQIFPLS
jgi:hypothetical protein